MDQKIFAQFAEIRRQKEALEAAEEVLRAEILRQMEKAKETSAKFDYGSFTLTSKKNYKYPDNVLVIEERLKLARLKAIEKGEAEVSETKYITYKPVKKEQTNED